MAAPGQTSVLSASAILGFLKKNGKGIRKKAFRKAAKGSLTDRAAAGQESVEFSAPETAQPTRVQLSPDKAWMENCLLGSTSFEKIFEERRANGTLPPKFPDPQ